MSQQVGYQYKSRIPSFSDDASIVEALKVYHYGVDNWTTEPIPDDSIEGNFRSLNISVSSLQSSISGFASTYLSRISSSSSPNVIVGQTITTAPLTLRAIASQTANLLNFQNSSSVNIGAVTSGGNMNLSGYITVGTTTQATTTGINVVLTGSGHSGVVIRAQSGQTGNLQEWKNSSGTNLALVNASGEFTMPSISSTIASLTTASATNLSVSGNQELNSFRVRNSYVSTSSPTGGNDGDMWFIYSA